MRRRRWAKDEFEQPKPPLAIKPMRAPRKKKPYPKLPTGGEETVHALDRFRQLLIEDATAGQVEQALGVLRGHLNFVRHMWRLNSASVADASTRAQNGLEEKYNAPGVKSKKKKEQTFRGLAPWEHY